MADLALVRRPSGRHDFLLENGNLATTTDHGPAILRLLLQGEWIGDDGERAGESLQDVEFIDQNTQARVQEIVERRLGVLLRQNKLVSVEVLEVRTEDTRLWAHIAVTRPGQEPETIQVPLGR